MNRATERLGRSGEYFAAAVLSLRSDSVLLMPPGSAADVIFDYEKTFLKVQVKTKQHRNKVDNGFWKFDIRRGSSTKERLFKASQVDLFALCCLKYNKVLFYPFHAVKTDRGTAKTAIYVRDDVIRNTASTDSLESALESISAKDV